MAAGRHDDGSDGDVVVKNPDELPTTRSLTPPHSSLLIKALVTGVLPMPAPSFTSCQTPSGSSGVFEVTFITVPLGDIVVLIERLSRWPSSRLCGLLPLPVLFLCLSWAWRVLIINCCSGSSPWAAKMVVTLTVARASRCWSLDPLQPQPIMFSTVSVAGNIVKLILVWLKRLVLFCWMSSTGLEGMKGIGVTWTDASKSRDPTPRMGAPGRAQPLPARLPPPEDPLCKLKKLAMQMPHQAADGGTNLEVMGMPLEEKTKMGRSWKADQRPRT
ncbi:wolframin [Lates japonicus]|uniref:Wolframin n=1 Tax=Lates japonicus TaxID=270547 RepID=A0AAD3MCE6_LATJO|nr:wolframin [Lates japonicus]